MTLCVFFRKEASSHDLISAGRKPIGNDLQWEIEGRLQRCSVDDSWIQSTMLVKKFLRRNNLPTSPGLFQFLSIYHQGCTNLLQPGSRAARKWRENEEMKRKWRENEEMKRKWRENEEMEREIHSQDFLILCLFPPSLSISYIKNCHILSQNAKYGTFVASVAKKLNMRAIRKSFLVEFAARKLRK